MLRWMGWSALACVVCATLGLGKVVPLGHGLENLFLTVAALSATVLFSSTDAYETQVVEADWDE